MAQMNGVELRATLERIGLTQHAAARVLMHFSPSKQSVTRTTMYRWTHGINPVPPPVAALVTAFALMSEAQRVQMPGWLEGSARPGPAEPMPDEAKPKPKAGRTPKPRPVLVMAEEVVAEEIAAPHKDVIADDREEWPDAAMPHAMPHSSSSSKHLLCWVQDDEHPRDLACKLAHTSINKRLLTCDRYAIKGASPYDRGRILVTCDSSDLEEGRWRVLTHSPQGYVEMAKWCAAALIRPKLRGVKGDAAIADIEDRITELEAWEPDTTDLADLVKVIREAEAEVEERNATCVPHDGDGTPPDAPNRGRRAALGEAEVRPFPEA
jgi:hypothetical protein